MADGDRRGGEEWEEEGYHLSHHECVREGVPRNHVGRQ